MLSIEPDRHRTGDIRRAPVGVYDSGVGGLSVLRSLRHELPHEHWVYFSDAANAPYGERDEATVRERALAVDARLRQAHGIKALVVACNTATAAGVQALRALPHDRPVVGLEPALKPAVAATRTGHVAVLATRATLASARFIALHASVREAARITLQPCDGLAAAIEAGDQSAIARLCRRYTVEAARFGPGPGEIDTVVLGCTHYPFATHVLQSLLGPSVTLVDTARPVAVQTRRVLTEADLLAPDDAPVHAVCWETSGDPAVLARAAARWLRAVD